MKTLIVITCLWSLFAFNAMAQETESVNSLPKKQKLFIREDITLHFTSPEPIQYVDISSKSLVGDLPLDNVFRIKMQEDSAPDGKNTQQGLGVVTIIGQNSFLNMTCNTLPATRMCTHWWRLYLQTCIPWILVPRRLPKMN